MNVCLIILTIFHLLGGMSVMISKDDKKIKITNIILVISQYILILGAIYGL